MGLQIRKVNFQKAYESGKTHISMHVANLLGKSKSYNYYCKYLIFYIFIIFIYLNCSNIYREKIHIVNKSNLINLCRLG